MDELHGLYMGSTNITWKLFLFGGDLLFVGLDIHEK